MENLLNKFIASASAELLRFILLRDANKLLPQFVPLWTPATQALPPALPCAVTVSSFHHRIHMHCSTTALQKEFQCKQLYQLCSNR
ncbi:unnamed protein product [Hydatigera taeniaeformis]|uniref:Secreted protein n=1 Tax=Hydatigena taeniaeformis TaxID=6205 RepID=A0A0R3X751_HYDTA|nr:unnamed protein product [Hydatigera taeniaeformis]